MQTIGQALAPRFRKLEAEVERMKAEDQKKQTTGEVSVKPSTSTPVDCGECRDYGGFWTELDEYGQARFKIYCKCSYGQKLKAGHEREHAKREQVARQQLVDRLFGEALMPPKFAKATVADFADKATLLKKARTGLAEENGLFLWGTPGTGKSHLAVALMRETIESGMPALFIEVPDLLAKIRQTFSGRNGGAEEMIEAVCKIDLLLLDDLGAEKPSDWVQEQIFRIVNTRYTHCRKTIATSNLGKKELGDRIGDRTVSRLIEMCKVIHLTGEDRRLKKQ